MPSFSEAILIGPKFPLLFDTISPEKLHKTMFKAFRLRKLLLGDGGKKREHVRLMKAPWMMPISHGYHVVEDQSFRGGSYETDSDSVVVQREQFEELELWFFGVFDPQIGDGITKYLQYHLFDTSPNESQIRKKTKETMQKAYLGARAKIRNTQKSDDQAWRVGSASVMVINGERLVIANMGEHRAVVCRDGQAHHVRSKNQRRRHWSRKLFSVRKFAWKSRKAAAATKCLKGSELVVGAEKIDANTEFVIIASTGVWQVLKNQEAVNLIRHMEDPQEAAECLAKEALSRMSKSNISCIVIRFD